AAEPLLERRPAEGAEHAGRPDGRGERQMLLGVGLSHADAFEELQVEVAVVRFAEEAELTRQVARDEARAVALHHRRRMRQPGGERRDAWLDEVVHVLRPQHEEVPRQVTARQRREESARSRLGALEGEALLEKLRGAEQLSGHGPTSSAGSARFTR